MAPTGTDIEGCDDIMGFLEKFIACPLYDAAEAEDVEEGDEEHGEAAPDDVGLRDEGLKDGRLGLIEFAFDDGPD